MASYLIAFGRGGSSAWFFDGSSTIELGLQDGVFTGSDGIRKSRAESLNEADQVIGYSTRFEGISNNGQSAWFGDAELDQFTE